MVSQDLQLKKGRSRVHSYDQLRLAIYDLLPDTDCLREDLHKKKNGKKDDIVHLSNYLHPPGLIVTAEIVTNPIN